MVKGGTRPVVLAAVVLGLLASGCAATRSTTDVVGGWFGRMPVTRPDPSVRPSARYSASARVAVRALPDTSSEVVAELARHEPVLLYQRRDGFAFVVAEKSGRSGWVSERALIDRLPAAPKASAAPNAPGAPAGPEAASPPEAAPEPAEEPPGEETAPPAPPQKSIFDPY